MKVVIKRSYGDAKKLKNFKEQLRRLKMELILQMNAEEAIEVTKNGTLKALAESLKTFSKDDSVPQAPSMDCASSQPVETPTQAPMPESTTPTWTPGGGATDDSAPQQTVPTEAKSYTADELQKAAIGLMDKGVSMDAIAGVLNKLGVATLPELTPDKFGAFALELRQLGADI